MDGTTGSRLIFQLVIIKNKHSSESTKEHIYLNCGETLLIIAVIYTISAVVKLRPEKKKKQNKQTQKQTGTDGSVG